VPLESQQEAKNINESERSPQTTSTPRSTSTCSDIRYFRSSRTSLLVCGTAVVCTVGGNTQIVTLNRKGKQIVRLHRRAATMAHLRNKALFGAQVGVAWTPVLKVRAGNLAAVGDIDNLTLFLHAGVNTGQKSRANNKNGRAALIRACISDQYEAVKLVLELGAEVSRSM
jgi:hypothetical protein